MTTTPLVKAEIQRFLSSGSAEVLCISGKWGVGKTFTWQQLLDGAVGDRSLKLGRYTMTRLQTIKMKYWIPFITHSRQTYRALLRLILMAPYRCSKNWGAPNRRKS